MVRRRVTEKDLIAKHGGLWHRAQPVEMEGFADRVIGAAGILDLHLEIGRDAHDTYEFRRRLAAALLGFALSIDDFVITYFVAGGEQTFPVFVWGIARVSVPPQVNVVASAIFVVAMAIALGNVLWQYRSAKRLQGAQ